MPIEGLMMGVKKPNYKEAYENLREHLCTQSDFKSRTIEELCKENIELRNTIVNLQIKIEGLHGR